MSLRARFLFYVVALHVLFLLLLLQVYPRYGSWTFALEGLLLVSLFFGIWLFRRLKEPFDFLRAGADNLKEENYGIRYLELKQPEMDRLIQLYNGMLQRLREERLRLGEQRGFLEKLMQATPAGILTFDFDDRISMVNQSAQRFLEMSSAELLDRPLNQIAHPLASELAKLTLGEPKLVNMPGRHRFKCHQSRFKDRGFYRKFIIVEELTQELRHTEKAAYEKLIRMMSHELNNTIGATNSLLQSCFLFRNRLPRADRSEFENALKVVISRNENLNAFMAAFANMVRIPDPKLEKTNPIELLRNLAVLLSAECERRRIEWRWDLRVENATVDMDRHQMEQVFMNIGKNAVEAIDRDGAITVRLAEHGNRLLLSIVDSGRCLTEAVRAHLFLPFFTTKASGHGIGLMLVQEILTRHGFDFALEGGPDKDTHFNIWFT